MLYEHFENVILWVKAKLQVIRVQKITCRVTFGYAIPKWMDMHTFAKDLGIVCSSLNARYIKLLMTSSQ